MEDAYTITYQGPWLSLNAVYSQHRWLRTQVKNEWKSTFTQMLTEAQIPPLAAFKLRIRYNSRMDLDNLTGGTKIFVDTMWALGLIPNDTKYIYQGNDTEPDLDLEDNTVVITILPRTPLPKRKSRRKAKPAPQEI